MFNPQKIQEISKQSKMEKWPFPKTAEVLREAGVDYYIVELATSQITYHGKEKCFSEPFPFVFQPHFSTDTLDVSGVKQAILKHQRERTSYHDFLLDIARSGVRNYKADLLNHEVIYYGKSAQERHIEKIPQVKKESL